MNKVVIFTIALFVCASLASEDVKEGREYDLELDTASLWDQWRLDFPSIVFEDEQDAERRFRIFETNVMRVKELNKKYEPDTHFMINAFAHLTTEEFKQSHLSQGMGELMRSLKRDGVPMLNFSSLAGSIPTAYDWRSKSPPVVTAVKDQGTCGSCWAFATTGNVEGQWALAGNSIVSLSEQNLVDCCQECWHPGVCDNGCEGGLMANTYTCVIKQGGIDTAASYPYVGMDGFCKFKASNIGSSIDDFGFIEQNEVAIATAVYEHGPIAVAVEASSWSFYKSGVYKGPCATDELNHAVIIVGFGVHVVNPPLPFWIIKNSWGTTWGEKGYMKLVKRGNECGIEEYPITSIINKKK